MAFYVFLTLLLTGGWVQHFVVVTFILVAHIFCGEQGWEDCEVLAVLWSYVCMVLISSGIPEVLICFPFVPCRPFTPCLLLSGSCCSCANRSCSVSAIHASEPTNTPALHSLLSCWGSALYELHSVLPQVKQRRTQAATKKSFFFFSFFKLAPANAQSSQKEVVCSAKDLWYQEQLDGILFQGNNFRITRDFPSFRVLQIAVFEGQGSWSVCFSVLFCFVFF